MEIYMVGGAVRDTLLGLPVKDRDWVVTGATPDEMLALGYRQVGRDFPVFLHPETHEEYALARTERKTAAGYTGFVVHAEPDVSLEEDLLRRDLTINAIAQASDGRLIDPFGGADDIQRCVLRHVSDAFSEDPLRLLRVARFAARFAALGFKVADDTLLLMRKIVVDDEAQSLVPERVWIETLRALGEQQPACYFDVLRQCGALEVIFPELDRLFGVPQTEKHHPEIDTGVHVMMALERAAELSADTRVRFAVLMHDLGKAETPEAEWPRHIAHEQRGVALVKGLCQRLRVPKEYRELAILASRFHTHCHRAAELKASTLLKTLEKLDAFRRPERFEHFLLVCEADARGRLGYESSAYPQAEIFRLALQAARKVDIKSIVAEGLNGSAVAERIHKQRIAAISSFQSTD